MHPYVGVLVRDLGGGMVDPFCHVTLISPTEAVTANHCAQRGVRVLLTVDNPILIPANLHGGVVRYGGWDFGQTEVDVAVIDLDQPIDLPRYAEAPDGPLDYHPGVVLDYVTYVGAKEAVFHSRGLNQGLPTDKDQQNEPAHAEFDRDVIRTTAIQGHHHYETETTVNTVNATCFGNSGSPLFPAGTDVIVAVLSYGPTCRGGGDSYYSRTDNDLAIGMLNGTVEPPPPPTSYPSPVEGTGTSGMVSFPATIRAGAEYTGTVTGITPATEHAGFVPEDAFAVFPASVSPGFRAFLAALRNEYTSGNDDLDVYLVWYEDGNPIAFFVSWRPGSDETVVLTPFDLGLVDDYGVDDLYDFEVWVNGFSTEGGASSFTLFTDELRVDEGNLTVTPTTAPADSPFVLIPIAWSGLDPAHRLHFGVIDHALDGVPEPLNKRSFVEISVP